MTGPDTLWRITEQYVARCCAAETPPRVSELAQIVGVSQCTLVRHFRRETPQLLSEVLKAIQLRHAKRMLHDPTVTTTRVAYACGYGTRRTFFRAFQRVMGMTPAAWREIARKCPYPCSECHCK